MMNTLKTLIEKLNTPCYRTLEKSAAICVERGHFNIEIEHWVLAILKEENAFFKKILVYYHCDVEKIIADINASLEELKIGNDRSPALSDRVIELINKSWLLASLSLNQSKINSGMLLLTFATKYPLRQLCLSLSKEFEKIDIEQASSVLDKLLADDSEENVRQEESQGTTGDVGSSHRGKEALNQFCINLNAQATQGKIDPAIGREDEINQVIDILSRRRQNNAILTGEPGVGKTAIVEGLALRIVNGDVPERFKKTIIYTLDFGLLQAGAGVKGEFENRLKNIVKEIKASQYPVILFIDEAHTIIGAGASPGQSDAANLLKPALARGELSCIAATTWKEYKLYFEKDAALSRRFQVVKVEEPSAKVTVQMLRSLSENFEQHHRVSIMDSAIQSAALLSHRYISGRHLPDKAVSVLDTACARVAGQQTAKPSALEKLEKSLYQLKLERARLLKEHQHFALHAESLKCLDQQIIDIEKQLKLLESRWRQEIDAVNEMITLRENLSKEAHDNPIKPIKSAGTIHSEMDKLVKKLALLQGDSPLVSPFVDHHAVSQVIADWTGIPVGKMANDDITRMLFLSDLLKERVVGQEEALKEIAAHLRIANAKLSNPNKPRGVFLFVGPSGVGKTETALALAEQLYHHEDRLTVINMSEFKEEHKISMLLGSPPGYVGYGEGGVLTEAVRRQPYSIILLDEMEKAHRGVQEMFYQIFDKGVVKDGQGRDINFKNTIIIMTSNACGHLISHELVSSNQLHDALSQYFKPAFLGRVQVIPYYSLGESILSEIVSLKLKRIQSRLQEEHKMQLIYLDHVVKKILSACHQQNIGARQIDNIINQSILPQLSQVVLNAVLEKNNEKSSKQDKKTFSEETVTLYLGLDQSGHFEVRKKRQGHRQALKHK